MKGSFHTVRHWLPFIFLSLLFLGNALRPTPLSAGEGEDEESKDTLSHFHYGAIFQQIPLTIPYLERMHDSLERSGAAGTDELERLREQLRGPAPSEEELVLMIDSLLDGGDVEKEGMRRIRVAIAKRKQRASSPFMLPYGDAPYPADPIYGVWNTRSIVPYRWEREEEERKLRLVAPEWGCDFQMPVEGELTSDYGRRDGRKHHGVDLDLRTGDAVRAAFPGMVRISRYFRGYGRVVLIRHYNGLETLYAHLHRADVKPGERVGAGERIGSGGNTGRSTGSHLHFEVRYKGISLNPAHFISFEEKELMGDTLVLKKQRNGYAAFPSGTRFHEVERGEHLYRIAQRYGVSIQKLCELNGIHRNQMLWVGQRIRVGS